MFNTATDFKTDLQKRRIASVQERLSSLDLWKFSAIFYLFGSGSSALYGVFRNDAYNLEYFFGAWISGMGWWTSTLLLMPLLIASSCYVAQRYTSKLTQYGFFALFVLVASGVQTSIGAHIVWISDFLWPDADSFDVPNINVALFYYSRFNLWHIDMQMYVLYVLLGVSLKWYEDGTNDKLEKEQLMAKVVESDLIALRSQLNPHFLFNVLNSISALVRTDRKAIALKALNNLSDLLRGILEQPDSSFCQVREELQLVDVYMQIQQLRYGEKLIFNQSISAQAQTFYIPSFLLLPLVENAIEHGSKNKCEIRLEMDVIEMNGEPRLKITLTNNVDSADNTSSTSGFGIGLGNNINRLNLIYGDNFSVAKKVHNETFSLELLLPDEF